MVAPEQRTEHEEIKYSTNLIDDRELEVCPMEETFKTSWRDPFALFVSMERMTRRRPLSCRINKPRCLHRNKSIVSQETFVAMSSVVLKLDESGVPFVIEKTTDRLLEDDIGGLMDILHAITAKKSDHETCHKIYW